MKKKKVKKKVKKVKRQKKEVISAQLLFYQKLWNVMIDNPIIECDLEGEDDEGRKYGYVEAAAVFRMYNKSFKKYMLICKPVGMDTVFGKNSVLVTTRFELTDVETGYSEIITGCGLGIGDWAANQAQTLAYKQALLNTFNCSWPQPEEFREKVRREIKTIFGPAENPIDIGSAVEKVFNKYRKKV